MGFRFRKSVKLAPGVRLNTSLGGVSATLGRRGASVNVGKRGVRGTVGIPGSGLSYSEQLTHSSAPRRAAQRRPGTGWKAVLLAAAVGAFGMWIALQSF